MSRVKEAETARGTERVRVSIIVVTWNGQGFLEDCLASLTGQTYQDFEVILVDNGSSDSSVEFVRARFPSVRIIELPENRGFAGGNLAGLEVAEGAFVALVNNDVRVDERWLEELMRMVPVDPGIGIWASKLIFHGTTKINSAGDGITTAGVGFNRGLGLEADSYNPVEPICGACGAAVLYRRTMLEEIGFLDEDFFLYDEDTDLSFRALLAGWKCLYVPGAIVHHKSNGSTGRLSDVLVYHHTRNLEFVWVKNMPARLMVRFAHHKLIQEVGAFCYLCFRHMKWRPFFTAKIDAIRMLPLMLRKRRQIQRKNKVSSRHIGRNLTSILSREIIRQKVRQVVSG